MDDEKSKPPTPELGSQLVFEPLGTVPHSSFPWKDQTFVAFDTETTGKYPLVAEVIEVAAVKWKQGKVIETFQSFVRPFSKMSDEIINIHHITNEMVENAPLIKDVLPQFDQFIRGSVLIAHRAAYDLGFLALEYEQLKMSLPGEKCLDSSILSQKAFPESPNHRLATLVSNLGIKVGQAHRALDDSIACLEVSLKAMEKLGADATLEFIFGLHGAPYEWPSFSVKDLLENELTRTIVEASKKKLVIEVVYGGPTVPARRVTPLGLVRNREGDYIVGYCHKDLVEKRFFLNRISSAKILD